MQHLLSPFENQVRELHQVGALRSQPPLGTFGGGKGNLPSGGCDLTAYTWHISLPLPSWCMPALMKKVHVAATGKRGDGPNRGPQVTGGGKEMYQVGAVRSQPPLGIFGGGEGHLPSGGCDLTARTWYMSLRPHPGACLL